MTTASREIMDAESPSIAARVLAPLALIACGLAIFVLVSGTLSGDDEGGERERPRNERPRQQPTVKGDTYTVVPGDTLSGIAERTGIRQGRLLRLNPDLDPATLNAGQQIKLKR